MEGTNGLLSQSSISEFRVHAEINSLLQKICQFELFEFRLSLEMSGGLSMKNANELNHQAINIGYINAVLPIFWTSLIVYPLKLLQIN